MRVSPRYLPAVCILLAVALVPTLIHSYAGTVVTDSHRTDAIATSIAGFDSQPSARSAGWGKQRFDSNDWMERRYIAGRSEVILTVVRSYDLKRLYHHPELDVAYGTAFVSHEVRRLAQNSAIPVHVLRTVEENGSVAMYALHYDDGFVENPLLFQLRLAGELLFSGRMPMTLFFARETKVASGANLETLPSARVLLAAIDQFARSASTN